MTSKDQEKAKPDPVSAAQSEVVADAPKTHITQTENPNHTGDENRTEELNTLNRLAKKFMWDTEAHRIMQKYGVQYGPNRFYSQVPSIDDIENSFEYDDEYAAKGPYWNDNIFDLDRVKHFMADIQKFADEFDPPVQGNLTSPNGYFWQNPAFSFCDAMAYYCNIRRAKPKRVLEIGSGYSSLVAMEALRKNGSGTLTCIEPYPMEWLEKGREKGGVMEGMELIKEPIQRMDINKINALLSDNDILFIDSTHTVKVGSDCLWIYLKMLPELTADLFVHVHDIPLPFAFPQARGIEDQVHWVEPYLLYAYLLENNRTEVYFGSMMAHQILPEYAKKFMGGKIRIHGQSMWLHHKGKPQSASKRNLRQTLSKLLPLSRSSTQ